MSIEDICTLYPELYCLMKKSQGYLLAKQWIMTEAFNCFVFLLSELKLYNNLERKEFLSHLYASNTVLPVAKLWWLHRVHLTSKLVKIGKYYRFIYISKLI